MKPKPSFKSAFPYQDDVLALPVVDLDTTSHWYCTHFGMNEVERTSKPIPSIVLERDATRIGFAVNGGDASQDGAAILVSDIQGIKREFNDRGVETGELRTDNRNGKLLNVFFVVAPDGLCYYFHEPQDVG